ncbi:hypothetical protein CP533_1572 [Ophiocordyceps camponoti-saundersi (nom. inval.)]|nr:hypothetical protein CP533_1572 [Ophiocordyceps camponoti-saundersi (nom. inval.)]
MSADRLPSLPLPLPSQAYSSGTSSPRVSSIASHAGSQSSFTSAASSNGPKTPSPTLPANAISAAPSGLVAYDAAAMNQSADMYYPQHMSAGQAPPPHTVTSGAMTHYQQQQPPLLQSGHAPYPHYGQYGYTNGLTSPTTATAVSNPMTAPQNVLPLPGGQGNMQNQYAGFDTTGQHPPPGMKPRVTATLWEDEGSLCFQVEARGICVARREDNHMINGTKLLNVAGMTRGRRDGILKSEKVRHVVKIGPMHLKGVWIPYDRALDFANKEKITEMLYPLFVQNIGALLYHPNNQSRTNPAMAATERRKQEQNQLRNPPPQGLPSIQQTHHHHHSMTGLAAPQPSLPSQSHVARPPLDRAHTFPTPPSTASGVIGSMAPSEGYGWQGQSMNGSQATTPPGTSMANMQSYSSAAPGYDNTRQMYNASASQQSPYQASANGTQDRMYTQNYTKSDMAPPSSRPTAGGTQGEQHDVKPPNGIMASETTQHPTGDDEADHEHDAEYTHDSGAYDASRTSYNYTAPGVGALANDGNMSSEMTGSPNHPPASGRATPRTTAPHQPYYQHTGYTTPPRVPSSSSLYNVAGSDRSQHGGASSTDVYAPASDIGGSIASSYASQSSIMNGSTGSLKRGRDDDDDNMSRSTADGSTGMAGLELKRRKTMMETTEQDLNPRTQRCDEGLRLRQVSTASDESSAFVSTVGETSASEQENWPASKATTEQDSRPGSKASSRHSRVISGTELSPLRILTEQRSSSPEMTAGTRSPRRLMPEKRFPVKISSGNDEAQIRTTMLPPTTEPAIAQEHGAGLRRAMVMLEDEHIEEAEGAEDDDGDDDGDDDDCRRSPTPDVVAAESAAAAAATATADEPACPDDTMMSTFSAFSAIPNLTMLARLGQSPSKLGLSPLAGRRETTTTTTNLLMDFTEQMRFPQPSAAGRANASPSRTTTATPLRTPAMNLLDLEMPPMPTPRSVPTITPRELESLKSGFLSDISSLKASLSGKEAEVQSLKAAVGDAEKRVGESQEQLREVRAVVEQLEGERERWEARGRDVEAVLEKIRSDMLAGQAERDELERKLDESEKRREAAEMLHQEAESKMAGMRAGKETTTTTTTTTTGHGTGNRPLSLSAAASNKNSDVEAAVEHVARELHALYKTKHDTKVAALKKSYEARWEKKVAGLEQRISELSAERDTLRQQLAVATTMTSTDKKEAEELRARAVRDSASIKERDADVDRLEAVVLTVRRDNEDLRRMLELERVEKGELVSSSTTTILLLVIIFVVTTTPTLIIIIIFEKTPTAGSTPTHGNGKDAQPPFLILHRRPHLRPEGSQFRPKGCAARQA